MATERDSPDSAQAFACAGCATNSVAYRKVIIEFHKPMRNQRRNRPAARPAFVRARVRDRREASRHTGGGS